MTGFTATNSLISGMTGASGATASYHFNEYSTVINRVLTGSAGEIYALNRQTDINNLIKGINDNLRILDQIENALTTNANESYDTLLKQQKRIELLEDELDALRKLLSR